MIAESDTIAYKLWAPRPDQPERYDEQESFYYSDLPGVAFLIGGNGAGCLSADQKIYDPHAGLSRKVSEINGEFHVWARNQHGQAVNVHKGSEVDGGWPRFFWLFRGVRQWVPEAEFRRDWKEAK